MAKKTTDTDWAARLAAAAKGDIAGDEVTEIVGELNNEGGPKLFHHLKSKKIYTRGIGKFKQVVPEAEAKQILKDWKKKIP